MMMLLAGIQGIPSELYESGRIDGANARQLFFHITIPELKSVIFAVLMLEITSGLNSFDLLFTMTSGGPGGMTEILGLLIHRLGFTNFDFGGASALSVLIIVVTFGVFLISGPAKKLRQHKEVL
jgi:multiple sugar transport system permease protein